MSNTRTVASRLGAHVLALVGALNALLVVAAPAAQTTDAGHQMLQGVWEPLGGAILDPTARAMPGNKGRPMPELSAFPPYNAEYQARYDKITADLRAGVRIIDGSAMCLPQGMPRMMVIGYPIDIIVQPKRVVMLFEPGQQRRIIHTDGRSHTDPAELDPTYSGESIGHWEGNTLVVDTVGIREDLVFDYSLAPHSDELRITERIRRLGDTLEIEMTLEDAKAFTRPWQIKRTYKLQPTWEIKEFVCDKE
jgi:hypothetical protein